MAEEEKVQLIDEETASIEVASRPRSYSHSRTEQRAVLKWLLLIAMNFAWGGIVFSMMTNEWIQLDKSMSFLNKGEIHEFILRLGLWQIEYEHLSYHRLNKASTVSLAISIDEACAGSTRSSDDVFFDQAACGPLLEARHEAVSATILTFMISLLGTPLCTNFLSGAIHFKCQLFFMTLLALGSFVLTLEARQNILFLLDTCIIQDAHANAKSFLGTSLADRACEQLALGFGPLLLLLSLMLANISVIAFRAQRLAWPTPLSFMTALCSTPSQNASAPKSVV